MMSGRELDHASYGLEEGEVVSTREHGEVTVAGLARALDTLYCGTTALECGQVEDGAERDWLCGRYQEVKSRDIPADMKKSLALEMMKSQTFDNFLATKFQSVKRYGGEGAEAMMGFFIQLFHEAKEQRLSDIVIAEVGIILLFILLISTYLNFKPYHTYFRSNHILQSSHRTKPYLCLSEIQILLECENRPKTCTHMHLFIIRYL